MKRAYVWISIATLFCISSCTLFDIGRKLSTTATPKINIEGPKIVFAASGRFVANSDYEIFIMNPDGSDVQAITKSAESDRYPAWSPDGQKITFASERDGNGEIYVMNADGSNPTRLTNDPATDTFPTWSPDGQRIAFSSARDGGATKVYIMNADGSNPTLLIDTGSVQDYPDWSPDGEHISFSDYGNGNTGIVQVHADGTDFQRLTSDADHQPRYSPDGQHIAFISNHAGWAIFTMNTDGSDIQQLTFYSVETFSACPTWSPDGTQIAFWSDFEGTGRENIYIMNADGSGATKITNSPESDVYNGPIELDWRP